MAGTKKTDVVSAFDEFMAAFEAFKEVNEDRLAKLQDKEEPTHTNKHHSKEAQDE